MQNTSLQEALNRAMALARAGQAEDAATLLAPILAAAPEQPDALQLLGMLARARGAHEEAVDLFARSLRAKPDQPHVHNNLGNSLLDLGRTAEAIAAYRTALGLQPDYRDALINLATAQLSSGDAASARILMEQMTQRAPRDGKAWMLLGQALQAQARYDDAVTALRTAQSLLPGHTPVAHNLAIVLRQAGKPGEAVALLRECAAADPASAMIRYSLGNCLYDLGFRAEAADAYRAAIAIDPCHRQAHDSLSRLRWQSGDIEGHLQSYRTALQAGTGDAGLLTDLANRLNMLGRSAETIALLAPRLAQGSDSAGLRHRLGQALWAQGRQDEALAQLTAARELDPADRAVAREAARCLIVLHRYPEALDALGDDMDQQAIAYRGLCWRFQGDPRAGWLNDYDRFVDETILQPSPEFGDAAAFNTRLESVLTALHDQAQHPLEQTLRGGTQTMGDLLDRPMPEIEAVRAMIEAAVHRYIDALPEDAAHPFLRRKTERFAFSGSWSVRLRRSGFHMNHVHPEGWISSCYYVGLPPAVDAGGQEGWLKLGETALHLGAREQTARLIRPQVGKLVLFPSYFYHGTVPFEDDTHRTTIAFDVVPGL